MKSKILSSFLFAVILFFGSCNCNNPQKKVDNKVAEMPVKLSVVRFDKEIFSTQSFDELAKQYPSFFKLYTERILQGGDKVHLEEANVLLKSFTENKSIIGLKDTVQKHFGDFSKYENELNKAFQYQKYYFPKMSLPKVYTFISEFGYGCITADSMLGIGLDMFLGEQYPYYTSLQFPKFIIKRCTPQNLIPSVMKAYGQGLIPEDNSKRALIDKMVESGKVLYYLDKVLPYYPDTIKINYTALQLEFCKYSEYKIWEFFIKHNLLFNTDMFETAHYIGDAPVTPGMPPATPGNIGAWVGWQIVKKYMDENPKITLEQLMKETDGQKILQASKYKPSKK
jgi:gliding motility-associated lipoprotein GldB